MILKKCVSALFFLVVASHISVAQFTIEEFPKNLQLYQRDGQDRANMKFAVAYGEKANFVSYKLQVFKEGSIIFQQNGAIEPGGRTEANVPIEAGLFEYSAFFYVQGIDGNFIVLKSAEKVLCGEIVAIYGQSNSFGFLGLDTMAFNADYIKYIRNVSSQFGAPIADNVQWYIGTEPYGQLGVFPLRLGGLLVKKQGVPQAFVTGAVGGAYIGQLHDRNDGLPFDLSTNYGKFLYKLNFADQNRSMKYLVWRQGESDASLVSEAGDYIAKFSALRESLLKDMPNLQMIYAAQNDIISRAFIATGEYAALTREEQRKLNALFPDVQVFSTTSTPGYDGLHYNYLGHDEIARKLAPMICADFYGCTDTTELNSPDIQRAFLSDSSNTVVLAFDLYQKMQFEEVIRYPNYQRFLKDFIYFDVEDIHVESMSADDHYIFLKINKPAKIKTVTYLPNYVNDNFSTTYNGPTLQNSKGNDALTFFEFPIANERLQPLENVSAKKQADQILLEWKSYSKSTPDTRILVERYNYDKFVILGDIQSDQTTFIDSNIVSSVGINDVYRFTVFDKTSESRKVITSLSRLTIKTNVLMPEFACTGAFVEVGLDTLSPAYSWFKRLDFKVELSDATGDFANPTLVKIAKGSRIQVELPKLNSKTANNFRFRVVPASSQILDSTIVDLIPSESFKLYEKAVAKLLNESPQPFQEEVSLKVQVTGSLPARLKVSSFDTLLVTAERFEIMSRPLVNGQNYSIEKLTNVCGLGTFSDNIIEIIAKPLGAETPPLVFKIYPNPVTNNLKVDFSSQINKSITLQIYDLSGKLQLSHNLISKSQNIIDLSKLRKGNYIVSLTSEGVVIGSTYIVK